MTTRNTNGVQMGEGPWHGGEDAEVEGKVGQDQITEGHECLARKFHFLPDTVRTINGSQA